MIGAKLLFLRTPSLQATPSGTPAESSQERGPTVFLQGLCSLLQRVSALRAVRIQAKHRRLRLQEIVQLGDKRFVAILRVDGQEFLVGGSTNALSLLSTLTPPAASQSFAASLAQAQATQSQPQSAQVQP